MYVQKKKARKYKKKTSSASYYPKISNTGVRRYVPPIRRVGPSGNSFYTVLKYAGDVALNPGVTGLAATQVFQNSAYDVDLTSAGHQPAGWDQLIALYEHCTVYAIDYKVQFQSTDTGVSVSGIYVSDNSTSDTDYRVFIENGQCEWAMTRLDNNPPPMTGRIDCAKIHGISRASMLGDNAYAATISTDPVDPIYMILFNGGAQNTDTGLVIATYEFTLHCYFYGSKKLSLS